MTYTDINDEKASRSEVKDMKQQTRKGQSLVEFALILPVLLVILVILADLSRSIAARVALSNAAREGARYAALYPDDIIGIRNRVLLEYNNSGMGVTGMELLYENIMISYPDGSDQPGNIVQVNAQCRLPLVFGSFFPVGVVDENGAMLLQTSAEMVVL